MIKIRNKANGLEYVITETSYEKQGDKDKFEVLQNVDVTAVPVFVQQHLENAQAPQTDHKPAKRGRKPK